MKRLTMRVGSTQVGAWHGGLLLLLGLVNSGCQEPRSVACGNVVCPEGKTCVEGRDICVFPEQEAACDGKERGDRCDVPGIADGICVGGICELSNCGDGNVSGAEVCDDGNNENGDGCSGDCLSDETCGNGEVDSAVGEACDDGNNEDGDGCTAMCAAAPCGNERLDQGEACDDGNNDSGDGCNQWCTSDETCGNGVIDIATGETCDDGNTEPGDTCGSTCQIEICGNEIVDAGEDCDDGNNAPGDGCGPSCLLEECGNGIIDQGEQCDDGDLQSRDGCNSICLLENLAWTMIPPGAFERDTGVGTFDSQRGVVVLFGGEESSEVLGDTWEFDGTDLVKLSPPVRPAARKQHVMGFHEGTGKVVVFGGLDVQGFYRWATWLWDGEQWRQTVPNPSPTPRAGAAMAYDGERDELVLFGGFRDSDDFDDTWLYDGVTWMEADTTASPPSGGGGTMAFDPNSEAVILYKAGETWEWDGSDWSENTTAGTATDGSMAYDTAAGSITIVGQTEKAEYDGSTWSVSSLDVGVLGFAHVFDSGNDNWWRFHAAGASSLSGTSWSARAGANFPGGGSSLSFYHPGRQEVIAYEIDLTRPGRRLWRFADDLWIPIDDGPEVMEWIGYDGTGITAGSWGGVYHYTSGSGWAASSATPITDGRSQTMPVYDTNRDRMILYGGVASSDETRDQLWEYDGNDWELFVPDERPIYRELPGLAFDQGRNEMVLFGGNSAAAGGYQDDTWVWDGSQWAQVATPDAPSSRNHPHMAYSPDDGLVYLFGGLDSQVRRDLWVFNGANWIELSAANAPPSVTADFAQLVYDEPRSRFLLLWGESSWGGAWQLQYESLLDDEMCNNLADDDMDGAVDCADDDCDGDLCDWGGKRCVDRACQ